MTTREERSRWLASLLRQALAEDRGKHELHTVVERAVEYGASAVQKPTIAEFAEMMRPHVFDVADPDYLLWTEAIDWNLRFGDMTAGQVISIMQDLGFTVIPPERREFGVFYNSVLIADFDDAALARQFMTGALIDGKPGYELRDRMGRSVPDGAA